MLRFMLTFVVVDGIIFIHTEVYLSIFNVVPGYSTMRLAVNCKILLKVERKVTL